MDSAQAQAKVDQLQAKVDQDNQTLTDDQAALEEAKKELSFVSLVNMLEGLTSDQIATLNEALKEDANALGITIALPSTAGEASPQA